MRKILRLWNYRRKMRGPVFHLSTSPLFGQGAHVYFNLCIGRRRFMLFHADMPLWFVLRFTRPNMMNVD